MTMDHPDQDEDLRQAFTALRRADAAQTPSFTEVMASRRAAARGRRLIPLLGGALAVACVVASIVVAVQARRGPPPPPALASIEAWTAPTDFLLRTPGSEVLGTVPRIGTRRTLLSLDGAGPLPGSK